MFENLIANLLCVGRLRVSESPNNRKKKCHNVRLLKLWSQGRNHHHSSLLPPLVQYPASSFICHHYLTAQFTFLKHFLTYNIHLFNIWYHDVVIWPYPIPLLYHLNPCNWASSIVHFGLQRQSNSLWSFANNTRFVAFWTWLRSWWRSHFSIWGCNLWRRVSKTCEIGRRGIWW